MKKYFCKDCSIDTRKDKKNFFMVNDVLWDKFGIGNGYLCLSCFENRLGRKLVKQDLTICFVNLNVNPYTKDLLKG